MAARLAGAIEADLQTIEQQPAIGAPTLGHELGIPDLRTWEVSGFPLVPIYIERLEYLDVVRLLGQRQNVAALIRTISA